MADNSWRSLTAALLLGWTLCLSLHSSLALAEMLHHHDGSELCAQAQLIDKWLQIAPCIAFDLTSVQPPQGALPPTHYRSWTPPYDTVGNRDPPSLQLS